ncbi:MAG: PAS domain S-box protein, partial [Thauera sp.]|nr:PAS domain S-box protein [Thauera sp.]
LMFSAEQYRGFLDLLDRVERSGGSEGPYEAVIEHRDGTPRNILYTTYGIPDNHGGTQFVCMDVDITSLRRSEAEEAAREKELQLIFNLSPAPIIVSTPVEGEFRALAANEACMRQFGMDREELLGKSGAELGWWENIGDRARFIERIRDQGRVADFETWMRARDGRRMLCSVSGARATIGGRELLIIVTVDITEERRMQDELRALNDELEQRVIARTEALARANQEVAQTLESLRQTQDQLVQSETLAALGRLVAGVAHELNTPIGNALMAVSTLRESSSGFQREVERGLRKSVLEAFVRDLATGLDISERNMHKAGELIASFKQVAVDQTSLQRRRFEVQEIVSETLMTLHPTLKRMPYEVLADVQPGLSMDSYPGPLGQVLANLINNAVTHAFDGRDHGVVRILARAQGEDRVSIRVADDGVGIPEAERKRVFDPFYTTRLGRGGTGLGLHIVHANVTRVLGGAVRLLDEEAGGSVFELDLPRVAP